MYSRPEIKDTMKKVFIPLFVLLLILNFTGCQKEDIILNRDYPRLDILENPMQTDSGISFEGIFLTRAGEITDKGFIWDIDEPHLSYGPRISLGPGYNDGMFTGTASYDLEKGIEYQVKAYAISQGRIIFSKAVGFTCTTNGIHHTLNQFLPQSGHVSDTVLIAGTNLSYQRERITVFFNMDTATVWNCTDTTITVTVPASLNRKEATIRVVINNIQQSFPDPFTLEEPVIDYIQPLEVNLPGEELIISGSGFSKIIENNQVLLGPYPAVIRSASSTQLRVGIPYSFIHDLEVSIDTTVEVSVTVAEKTVVAHDSLRFNYIAAWTRMNDFPGSVRKNSLSFGNGNKGFYGLGSNADGSQYFNDLWEYDPALDTWSQRSSFPGPARVYSATFTINNQLFLVGGSTGDPAVATNHSNEIWMYDMDSDEWTRLNDFPGTPRIRAAGFAAGGNGYLISGCHENDTMNSEVWEYLVDTDSWTRRNDLPNMEDLTFDNFLLRGLDNAESGGILCKLNAEYYNIHTHLIYDPASDGWSGYGFPGTFEGQPPSCHIGNLIYFGPARYPGAVIPDRIYTYDPEVNSWGYRTFIGSSRLDAGCFSIGNNLYFIGGEAASGNELLQDVWMLDTTR